MNDINKIKRIAQRDNVNLALVFKEHVQLLILEYLFRKGLFSSLVFQGGTALRLAYQGVRYSEDLDFVLTKKDPAQFKAVGVQLQALASHVKKHLPMISQARLKTQKTTETLQRYTLAVEADFLNAKDKTNIEIVNVPSYDHQTVMIRNPELAMSPAVTVESPSEILSDKIVAFAGRPYLKGRDLWDIFFLMETLKIPAGQDVLAMVKNKFQDYGLSRSKAPDLIRQKISLLEESGTRILHEEMDRFLPGSYRDVYAPRYPDICEFEKRIFEQILEGLRS